MLAQFVFLVLLYAFGVLFALLLLGPRNLHVGVVSGFLWGALLWVISGVVALSVRLPFTIPTLVAVASAILACVFFLGRNLPKESQPERPSWRVLAMLCFGAVLLAGLCATTNFTVFSQDSFSQIVAGRAIAREAGIPHAAIEVPRIDDGEAVLTQHVLATRGIFVPLLQSGAPLLGLDYLWAMHPYFAIALLATFALLLGSSLGIVGVSWRTRVWVSAGAALLLLSTYIALYHGFYVHNNLATGAYLLLAVGSAWLASTTKQPRWWAAASVALVGIALLRFEGLPLALLVAAPMTASRLDVGRIRAGVVWPAAVLLCVWFLALPPNLVGGDGRHLTPARCYAFVAVILAFSTALSCSHVAVVERLLRLLPALTLYGGILSFVVFSAWRWRHMGESFDAWSYNLVGEGGWGATWIAVAFLFCVAWRLPPLPHERLFTYPLATCLFFYQDIVAFRSPFRLGIGDSGNRAMLHLLPLALFYVALKISAGSHENADAGRDT